MVELKETVLEIEEKIQNLYKEKSSIEREKTIIESDVSDQRKARNIIMEEKKKLIESVYINIKKQKTIKQETDRIQIELSLFKKQSEKEELNIRKNIDDLKKQEIPLKRKKTQLKNINNDISNKIIIIWDYNKNIYSLNTEYRVLLEKKSNIEISNKKEENKINIRNEKSKVMLWENKIEKRRLSILYNDMNKYCKENNIPLYKK